MKHTKYRWLVVFAGVVLITAGCSPQKKICLPDFSAQPIDAGMYEKKVDNFMVVLDSSSSMDDDYQGVSKFEWAKGVLGRLNETLPKDVTLMTEMTTFGHRTQATHKPVLSPIDFGKYEQKKYKEILDALPAPGGTSRMDLALSELKTVSGKTALIIVSDGEVSAPETLTALKKQTTEYGDRLCVYAVQVGDSPAGRMALEQMVKTGSCGKVVQAQDIASGAAMNGFAQTVFFQELKDSDGDGVVDRSDRCPNTPTGVKVDSVGCPLDSDGDGVYDYLDRCPGTPRGVKVDSAGCPLDTDGDGVTDDKDNCPGTPAGVIVDAVGCPKSAKITDKGTWIYEDIQFDTAKWSFKPGAFAVLDEIVQTLTINSNVKVEIQGHTDNRGSAAYNQTLSEKRAKAVMGYLVSKGISPDRLTAIGYGAAMPMETNDTDNGRAANRRVEFKPIQ